MKKGFTLIELLVVIAIIGILSSVVVVSLNSARAKARDAKRELDVQMVSKALAMYFDSSGAYHATIATLSPTYLPTAPVAPNVGETYSYVPSADGLSYHLGARLEQVTSGVGVLASDRDCNSSSGATTNLCFATGVVGGFDGADPVYDLVP